MHNYQIFTSSGQAKSIWDEAEQTVRNFHRLFRFMRANRSVLVGGSWALEGIAGPNKSVKGTRRPLAVLKFGFYQGSAASFKLSERRAPYRNVGQS